MTKERLEWIMSGIDQSRLNKLEKKYIQKIEKKQAQDLTRSQEENLEKLYRFRSRFRTAGRNGY